MVPEVPRVYVIETGIPIPAEDWSPVGKGLPLFEKLRPTGYAGTKYPWATLRVRQSFLVPTARKRRELDLRMKAAGRALGREFTSRVVKGGIRIWRTA